MENDIPRLCGGIFLTLLLRAANDEFGERDSYYTEKGNTPPTERDVLGALWSVSSPSYKPPTKNDGKKYSSFRTTTSGYKSCRINNGAGIPDPNGNVKEEFMKLMQQSYENAVVQMSDITEAYLNPARNGDGLARALIEVIADDATIGDEDVFWIDLNGQPTTKEELKERKEIDLVPFLLGVWYYIVEYRDNNKVGRSTFLSWHAEKEVKYGEGKDNGRNVFISDVGKNRYRDVQVKTLFYYLREKVQGDTEDTGEKKIPLMYDLNGAFPELTEDGGYIMVPVLHPEVDEDEEDDYDEETERYLEKLRDKYSMVKTILYREQPVPFDEVYVCNDIVHIGTVRDKETGKYMHSITTISRVTVDVFSHISHFIVISGTGGLGKSMMMRHLLLDAIENYEEYGWVPIFLSLKDYKPDGRKLLDYITDKYNEFSTFDEELVRKQLLCLLKEGRCLLLFDGLDEMSKEARENFDYELEILADRFSNSLFIISSRPFTSFISYDRFTVIELQPFDEDNALELVDKLQFREDEPGIKKGFRERLQNDLFYTHKSFTENPLLLTLMMMMYEQYMDIPSKIHEFYHEAFLTLAQKHDANKALKRRLHTGLTTGEFERVFAEFCGRTYPDDKYEFTRAEFDQYFSRLKRAKDYGIQSEDFLRDLVYNICLMYPEGQTYHFTHRSFQEYFCALFFSQQKDKRLGGIGREFENKMDGRSGEKTFGMLYDMIPLDVEEYILLPHLEKLFSKCEKENGYWTFLEKTYPEIEYNYGEYPSGAYNFPRSFLTDFVIKLLDVDCSHEELLLPYVEDFVVGKRTVTVEDISETMDALGLHSDPIFNEAGEYDTYQLMFSVKELCNKPVIGLKLRQELYDDEFPMKIQYVELKKYYNELSEKYRHEEPDEEDFLDCLE